MPPVPEWLNPPGVFTPLAHYSHVARAGNTLYISGQLAFDQNGQVVGIGDAREQARQCWKNLTAILAHFGATPRHILKTTTFVTHSAYRPLVAEARDELFSEAPYPPNTLVVITSLAEPHFLVEIEAVAVID